MTRHLKRHEAPKNWPISRKGTTFVLKKNSKGIPILIVLRDLMKIARTRNEVKQAVHKKDLIISNKPVNDEKKSLELFDILKIVPSKKNYRVVLSEKGKYDVEEINESETGSKISKIIGKRSLKGKEIQLNLSDGRNYISALKCSIGDSAIVDLQKRKISKILSIKEKSDVLVIGGKHAGTKGKILKIVEGNKMVELESSEKKFRALIKQVMVLN
ncbi:hypothetical protein COU58_03730 [Candidatus Pacearchaeota archaeon CG10_big_fil_rev_8_21_14_0_10_32_42]|nr:MAG: hypothetical protein COU58_03730 [Candidatus Pacearchaeota archaeon CG10_big_fil_rev_8_21_14_0_10_32_42]